MSITFHVAAGSSGPPARDMLPSFNAIVAASGLREPVQLTGAGWTGAAWPKGLLVNIVDAAAAPAKMELTPELEASFARAGLRGSFIAWTRGAARGVVVDRSGDGLALHVPLLAAAADYLLAAGLAAGAARLLAVEVRIEDPGAPGRGLSFAPDALLAHWTREVADTHARQVGTWIADDVAAGRTYFFHGPRGTIALGPAELAGVLEGARFERARAILAGEGASAAPGPREAPADARREAVLVTAAMVFAAGADGVLADEEARQLEAHFATVEELAGFDARELMSAVAKEVKDIAALADLGALGLRRKAFVLAAEVIASARDGALGGDPADPNVQAVSALAKALLLEEDQMFLAQVVRTVIAKYEDAKDAALAGDLALAMLLVASADGKIDAQETAVLSALARTVPDLRGHDVGELFARARARIEAGTEEALASLAKMPRGKNKCFALATEVALVTGLTHERTLLPTLAARLAPDRDYADAAIATFAAKYA